MNTKTNILHCNQPRTSINKKNVENSVIEEPDPLSSDEMSYKRIDEKRFIQWGKVHVLTTQGVVIKRIYDADKGIKCNSFNPEYQDFIVPKEDIYSRSLVVGLLRL